MRSFVLALAALLLATSCFDPVHQDAVDELGPEKNGEEPGPTHRRGQPCLTCHGGKGPGSPEFSVAGTVYAVRGGSEVAPGVTVVITDLDGRSQSVVTNRAGNFYIEKKQWDPVFPLHVRLEGGDKPKEMISRIGGNGACASCHRAAGDNRHMPAVYLSEQ